MGKVSMFRETGQSQIDPTRFGVGSIIKAGEREMYLVVQHTVHVVGLLNLQTFEIMNGRVEVEDVNYLSETDARELVRNADLNGAFSDYDCESTGLKR